MKKEKWKRFKHDKNYLISSWGRVFSFKTNQLIKPYVHKSRANNYLRARLSDNKKYMVHIMVCEHFHKKPSPEFDQVNHKDRNTLNPNENNVEWTTEKDNKLHLSLTNFLIYWGKKYSLRKKSKNET